jgi:2-methylisocitrate lyase-like PEP mutase family enzyme
MPTPSEKRTTFRRLHESGCFVIPNPWDVGSARYLQTLGFKALASTSSGFAWSQALPDNGVPRETVLKHFAEMAAATDVPLNADFESGFAQDAAGVGESVRLCCETGVAGLSIEDSTGDKGNPLFDFDTAVARVRAARAAVDKAGGDVVFTARCEGFLVGVADMAEVTRRLKAYSDAGADCLYAPAIKTREQIAEIVKAVAPKPVNVLIGWASDLSVADIASLGARRISVGGAMARSAWGGFMKAAKELAAAGTFNGFVGAAPGAELNALFCDDMAKRKHS